jgi:hypothetical protein
VFLAAGRLHRTTGNGRRAGLEWNPWLVEVEGGKLFSLGSLLLHRQAHTPISLLW